MSSLDRLRALRAAAPGALARQRKTLGQVGYGWRHAQVLSFVFGCQRSGTKMMMRVLDRSPATRIFHENNPLAFHDFQLRSDGVVRALARANPAPAVLFKPICDSHEADRILGRFPRARGVWIYRHPDDVASSAAKKWGAHQRELVDAVAAGQLDRWGWRTARLSEAQVAAVRAVHRPDLSEHEGGLLFWYLRNSFFFELGLDAHPRMLLARYEDLVQAPEAAFRPVFEWVGAPFEAGFLDRIHAGSVRHHASPPVHPEIRALCDGLLSRLDAHVRALAETHTAAAGGSERAAPRALVSPVLMLINTMGVGGAEKYVAVVSNWLAEHGAEVTIAAEHGELVETLRPEVRFVPTALGRVRGELPRMARGLRELIVEQRPAAIVTNSLAVLLVARLAVFGTDIPVVNVAHGWPADRYRVVGPLMRAADRVVAVSPEVRDHLVAAGLDSTRCEVIHNGVDCRPLAPREGELRDRVRASLGAGPDDVLVVTLGRLQAQKAHHHVIAIAAALRDRVPTLRYAIVGEGDRQVELAGLARDAGVADRVRLPGLRQDVPDLLGSADIYLSCSDWEGMPLSTIEAMASGLPTVATRTEGSGQLLDAESGIVVPVADVAAMSAAVERLALDPQLRRRLGDAASTRARASFSHDRMARELAALLGRLG